MLVINKIFQKGDLEVLIHVDIKKHDVKHFHDFLFLFSHIDFSNLKQLFCGTTRKTLSIH